MSIFNRKKEKEEIRELINTIEYCHVIIEDFTNMRNNLIVYKDSYIPGTQEKFMDDYTNRLAHTKVLLSETRQRLRELGVY